MLKLIQIRGIYMFNKSKVVMVAGLVLVLSVPSLALAQESPVAPVDNSVTATQAPTSAQAAVPAGLTLPDTPNTIKERIEAAKAKTSSRLSTQREERIKQTCQSAQDKTTGLSSRLETKFANRSSNFSLMSDKLNNLVAKLQLAQVDTTNLQAIVTEMSTLVAVAEAESTMYETNISDVGEVDCRNESVGFVALIESARLKRAEVLSNYSNLKDILNNKLKIELQGIQAQLSDDSGSSESGE
jgi:Skp family chaperone for outer membrane proteins